jgi:hypothetical protein
VYRHALASVIALITSEPGIDERQGCGVGNDSRPDAPCRETLKQSLLTRSGLLALLQGAPAADVST